MLQVRSCYVKNWWCNSICVFPTPQGVRKKRVSFHPSSVCTKLLAQKMVPKQLTADWSLSGLFLVVCSRWFFHFFFICWVGPCNFLVRQCVLGCCDFVGRKLIERYMAEIFWQPHPRNGWDMVNFSTKHKLGGCYPRIEASRERVSCAEVDIAVPWNLKCAKPPKFSRPGRVVEARIQGCE